MPVEFRFACPLPNGLHARPASHLAAVVARLGSQATLRNERNGNTGDAASVLDLVSLGALYGDACVIELHGSDEAEELIALSRYIETEWPASDEPLPAVPPTIAGSLPRVLAEEQVQCLTGTPVCAGVGIGQLVDLGGVHLPALDMTAVADDPQTEAACAESALAAVTASIQSQVDLAIVPAEAEIMRATLAIASDVAFVRELHRQVFEQFLPAPQAVAATVQTFAERLLASGSAYLRERVVDLQDLGSRLLHILTGADMVSVPALTGPSIVVAQQLAPRQLLALDRSMLCGLALGDAGSTSHAVILARSFGIPTLTGVQQPAAALTGQFAVLDAVRGLLLAPITPAVQSFYMQETVWQAQRQQCMSGEVLAPARTRDGVRIEISANIATDAEAAPAVANGAEGVGLFRTEMLFTGRDEPPTEDEQFAVYQRTVEALQGRTLIIRTIDIGGDKPVPYLNLPREDNPFLGYRGLRMYAAHGGIVQAQLRAIARASAHGPVWVMAPMVSTVEEARWFREQVQEAQAELAAAGIACDTNMPVGIMLEVPAAALAVSALSEVVDFFSIGTNDLCQYFMAVDRGNHQVAGLYNTRHPAFLRLLQLAVDEARRCGKWIGMCGEMARDPANIPLLLGLGLNELSLSAPNIPELKHAIARSDTEACRQLLAAALASKTAAQVDELLARFPAAIERPSLLDPALVRLDAQCTSKAEVLHELAGLMYAAGRCTAIDALETALWDREAAFSTGLGYGFAIPHCKSEAVAAHSLAVLRLREPIAWESLDGLPVQTVIMLAAQAGNEDNAHLRIFAKLARKLMDEAFREAMQNIASPRAALALLTRELELNSEEV